MRIGIDLGGTKIEGVVLTSKSEIIARQHMDTPKNQYQATINVIVDMVNSLERTVGENCTIGIGTPGAISKTTGLMKNCNSTCLNGMPLLQDLQNSLKREIRMANDADCFTLSEAIDGAAMHATSVFGVIVGTGTGGGICIEKQLVKGANSIAGEWGHNPLFNYMDSCETDRACYCGRKNCVETFLSGRGLTHTYFHLTGAEKSAEEIHQAWQDGEGGAQTALDDYCLHFSMALANVINVLDPDVIVLGGGLSNIDYLYQRVPELLPEFVFSDSIETKIIKAQFGSASGVRGAAWLWNTDPAFRYETKI